LIGYDARYLKHWNIKLSTTVFGKKTKRKRIEKKDPYFRPGRGSIRKYLKSKTKRMLRKWCPVNNDKL
jgi:hypothetical protein